ncbi:MAG: RNA methyltransferase, partial [Kiritimatiellae bacterium]|nr:RNA methyltransferase [Kiritimatiellia bacterium]
MPEGSSKTMTAAVAISSLSNPNVKKAVKLRQRSHRDEMGLMIIEGYREITRALDNRHFPVELFYCKDYFTGKNENTLIQRCLEGKTQLFECTAAVFDKMAYRDRPEGLLAVAPQIRNSLDKLTIPANALVVVAESIEKPGNLGTILRSADAAGVNAVIVCDRCTDINNPNVVRASIGTLFSLPVVETSSAEAQTWLKKHNIRTIAATPHTDKLYTQVDMTLPTAIVLGTEQYGLSELWLAEKHIKVRIPMLGQCVSLNVASAATILLFEAV